MRTRRAAATMFAAAAFLGAGAVSASAISPPTSCESRVGHVTCLVMTTNVRVNTPVPSYRQAASEIFAWLLNPSNSPMG